jgi:hypothetical protein
MGDVTMYKPNLIMLLAVVSKSAMAEWVNLGMGHGHGKTFTSYAGPATTY